MEVECPIHRHYDGIFVSSPHHHQAPDQCHLCCFYSGQCRYRLPSICFVNPDISGDETKAVFSMVLSLSLDGSGQRPVHGTWDLGPTSFVSIKLQLKTGLRP